MESVYEDWRYIQQYHTPKFHFVFLPHLVNRFWRWNTPTYKFLHGVQALLKVHRNWAFGYVHIEKVYVLVKIHYE